MREINETAEYFKNIDGFKRLMEGMYEQYLRHERCFGAVRLSHPTPEEEAALSSFFKRDYYNQALIRIGLADFERQAQKVFFQEFRLEALLEAYFSKKLGRKHTARVNNAFSQFVENKLLPAYANTAAEPWLSEISRHIRRMYRMWADRYLQAPEAVEKAIRTVSDALNHLPEASAAGGAQSSAVRLSEFALARTGDAHIFDASEQYGQLFLRALTKTFDTTYPDSPEERCALYYSAGLLTDGVLCRVSARGLIALRDGTPDEITAAYDKRGEAYALSLESVHRFTEARAYGGRVFIIENPHVFSAVNEWTRGLNCTLLCADEGYNPAVRRLFDLLYASGTEMYYSGDMDYPSLCYADNLYIMYPKRFIPWRYKKEDYERLIAGAEFFLPEYKKESGLYNEELAALLSMMRKRGKSASQDGLLPDLVNDIREFCENVNPAASSETRS